MGQELRETAGAGCPFAYDPFSLEAMTNPLPLYAVLREAHPAYYMPQYDAWAISRFADVWDGLLDSKNFSEVEGQLIAREKMLEHHHGAPAPASVDPLAPFPMLDGAVHTRVRQMMAPPLLKPAINRMEPLITALATERLKYLAERGQFDISVDFAAYVSAGAVSHIVGLTPEDVPEVVRLVAIAMARAPGQSGFTAAGGQAFAELSAMLVHAVANRRQGRGHAVPLIDAFFVKGVNDRLLSDQEIAGHLVSILIGGAETVPKLVSGGVLELLRSPRQLAEISADPQAHVPIAVEEMLRYNAPAQWFARTAIRARDLAGATIRPGQRVVLLTASANRDPREFEDPDRFIWNRRTRRLLSFGIGPHFCIGIHLARLEMQVMLREILPWLPRCRADEAAGAWSISEFQIGWTSLPIRIAA